MSLEIVFYVIPPSVQNAQTWRTIDAVVIKRRQIENGHTPVSGNIFNFDSGPHEPIIGIVKGDVVASSFVQHCFDQRECLGSLTCVSLKDAQLKIKFFLNGSGIPHFKPYTEPTIIKPAIFAPASTEITVEPTRRPLRGITHDWRKNFVAPPQAHTRSSQPNDVMSRYLRLPKAMRERLGAAMKANAAAKVKLG